MDIFKYLKPKKNINKQPGVAVVAEDINIILKQLNDILGKSAQVLTKKITISSAELNTLYSQFVELLPSLPSNKYYNLISANAYYHFNTVSPNYGGGGMFIVRVSPSATQPLDSNTENKYQLSRIQIGDIANYSADCFYNNTVIAENTNDLSIENSLGAKVVLFAQSQDSSTVSDSTLDIYLQYMILDI